MALTLWTLANGSSAENYFEDLMTFAENLNKEDERHVREGLTEDELELYDLLKKDKLTKAEEQAVKLAAKDLIIRLLQSPPRVLVQDWWKDGQTQAQVKVAIEGVLDNNLPVRRLLPHPMPQRLPLGETQ